MAGGNPARPKARRLAGLGIDIFSVLACVWYATLLSRGMDVNFDQLSYHYYYSWLLFNGGVAQVDPEPFTNRYVNPLPELPWFLLDTTFSPRVTAGFMGLLAGLNLPLLRRVTMVCLPNRMGPGRRLALGATSVLIGGTGVVFSMSLGTSLGDVLVSIPALGALLILLKLGRQRFGSRATALWYLAAGGLGGVAVGAKLTMAPLVIGLGVLVLVLAIRDRSVRPVGVFALGGAAGVALSAGWWYVQVWAATGNPIFPYFNGVFRSPLWGAENFRDERFGAGSIGGLMSFPIYMWEGSRRLLDYEIRDPRWVVLSGLVVIAIAVGVVRRVRGGRVRGRRVLKTVDVAPAGLLCGFFAVSALVWAFQFGIARYAVVLELLTGALFVLALQYVLRREWLAAGLGIAVVGSMLPFTRGAVEHVPFARDRYQVDSAPFSAIPAGSEVLVNAYSAPSAFMLPEVGNGVKQHVVHPWFYGSPLLEKLKVQELSKAKHIFVIQRNDWQRQKVRVRQFQEALDLRVLPDTCVVVKSSVRDRVLCRAEWAGD